MRSQSSVVPESFTGTACIAVLEPVVQCLSTDRGKRMVSQLQQMLGDVRKEERATKDRRYVPRVLSQEEYEYVRKTGNVERA